MTFRTALAFASVSFFSVACDDTQADMTAQADREATAARMAEPGSLADFPVLEDDIWPDNPDEAAIQQLVLDGREVVEVGFLAQVNAFGDPTLYVYDAADFPNAACAKPFSGRSVPDFAPGDATANDPVEVPLLRLRYQAKTGDWSGETVTFVDTGTEVSFEDRVSGLVQVHAEEVPRAVGEALVLDVTFMELPSIFSEESPALSTQNPGQPWVGPTGFIEGPVPGLHLGEALPFATGQARDYALNGGRTWAELSVDLDVDCASGH